MPDARALGQTSALSLGWSRWGICALLFFATTLNYIDRQVIGILKPDLSRELGWSEIDYSNIIFAFQIAGRSLIARLPSTIWISSSSTLARAKG